MKDINENLFNQFNKLIEIVKILREKCPWDKKQTFKSLRHLTIEEVYEISEAIINDDIENIKEELGDLLLHIVLYSVIGDEKKQFTLYSIISNLIEKLIIRHPHIFQNPIQLTAEEVSKQWEELKRKEKKSIFEGLPKGLPSILKAKRIQEKVSALGYSFNIQESIDNIEKKIKKLGAKPPENDKNKLKKQVGNLLFELINYSRVLNIDLEEALEDINNSFIIEYESKKDN